MDDFEKYLAESLKDAEFKKEWDASELEFQIQDMLVKARAKAKLTQNELSKLSGIRQSNISRIENGTCLPKLETLAILAKAMGKKLKIEIV